MTADEVWGSFYLPEMKEWSMEYAHKDSTFFYKNQNPGFSILHTYHFHADSVIHMNFLEPGPTNNSKTALRHTNFETTEQTSEAQEGQ